ncbi:uncharacterized protein [Panulirus ornatus]|uniref:uncharacterized protein n=1 Tax=Panulirus ornatus TaxID=150431 RepID=UPI003A8BD4A1
MDMLASANSVMLSTKTAVDTFSTGLSNLADSLGSLTFLAIMAGAMVVSAGIGGLSFTGIARMDEYFGWPLWSRIFPKWRKDDLGDTFEERSLDVVAFEVLKLLSDAVTKYSHSHTQK